MNKFLSVVRSDMKNIRRDPTLLLLLFVPLIMLVLLRTAMPLAAVYYPEICHYYPVILGLFALLNASFPAIIGAFILLDEKDVSLFPVIQVTPVSLSGFMLVRLQYLTVMGLLTSIMLITFNGFYAVSLMQSIALALLCVMNAPILLLLIVALSKNKVEGMANLKVANIVLLLPVAVFFLAPPYEYLLSVFPAFWVFAFLETMKPVGVFMLGFPLLLLYNILSFSFFIKRTTKSA